MSGQQHHPCLFCTWPFKGPWRALMKQTLVGTAAPTPYCQTLLPLLWVGVDMGSVGGSGGGRP